MKVIAAAIIFTLLPEISFSSSRSIQFRDRYGNLVETKEDTETIPLSVIVTGILLEPSVTTVKVVKPSGTEAETK